MEKTWNIYAAHTIYGLGAVLSEKRIPEREDNLYAELRYERTFRGQTLAEGRFAGVMRD